MAWFNSNKIGGHHGLQPVITDKHSVVEYSESRSSESYGREQFVAFGRVPPTMDHEHSPPRHELFQHQMGGGTNPFSGFWSPADDRTGKVDEFSPEHGNCAVNWREKGPPTNKTYRDDHSVPRDYGKHDHFNSSDTDDDYDYDDDDDIICNDGVCIRNNKGGANTKHLIDPYNRKPSYGDNNENHRGNGKFAPPYSGPFTTQPRKDPPYETSHVDNKEKPKGNGYSSPRYGVRAAPQPQKDTYYGIPYADDNEKRTENGYFAPPYRGSVTTQPKQDTSYDDNNGKYKGNGYSSPRYSGPRASQPRNDTYYGPSNDSLRLTGPPPIKTRSDTGRLSKSENNSPVAIAGQQRDFSSSPRKYEGNPETIDSAEARRRYARGSPRAKVYGEETHAGVIDSREAARKYQGVFVPSGRPF